MSLHDSKAMMMWKVSKEQEGQLIPEVFQYLETSSIDKTKLVGIKDELKDLFKMIRGAEYRRGKEDGKEEREKELDNESDVAFGSLYSIITIRDREERRDQLNLWVKTFKEELTSSANNKNSQHPKIIEPEAGEELKPQVSGCEVDNGSSADSLRGICKCGHHTRDHSYDVNFKDNLRCDICDCKDFVFQRKSEVKDDK